MATPIGQLSVDLLLQSTEFVRSINRASEQVNQLGRAVNQQTAVMSRSFDTVTASLKSMAAGLAGVLTVQTFTRATREAFAWADALQEASKRVGIGVEQMQRLQRAGELTNVSQEQITKNLEHFARGLGDAAKGTGTLKDALARTGIELRNSDGSLRSVSSVFDEYTSAIANAATEQEALTLSVDAFKRGGAGFVTTINEMNDGLTKFDVLTAQQVEKLGEYDDRLTTFAASFELEFKKRLVGSIEEGERLIAIFDQLFGTNIANAALVTSVGDLNTKLEESANLLERYQDVAAQVQAGAGIQTPGTDERILDLERDRIALLNQLKRAAEDAAVGVGTLGDAADQAGDDLNKFADDIRKANSAAGEGLADLEMEAAGLEVAEARKEVEAYDRALQENAQETKRAADEATRLAEARNKGIAALKVETHDLERLVAAHKEGTAEVRRVELAIEAENQMRLLNVALGSETAAVIETEIQRRRELTEAVDMLAEAEERRMEVFRAMNEEEMGRRMGQAEAGGMSAPGTPEDVEREMSEPFENALKSIQSEFTNTFEQLQLGGIRTFEDIADAAQGIFANLNANILSLAIFDPQGLKELAAQHGISPGLLTGGAAATTLAPAALGLFGARQAAQNASIGGGIGAGVGALAGSFIPGVGTALGALGGGLIGTAAGGLFGGLFGGGSGGSQVSFGGSALGKAGAGGTGEAAKFIAQLDTQLIGLLNFRQEKLTNDLLSKAKSTSVQYGEEGPSANDLAALAGARIRPAAAALGFSSAVGRGAPEQQMANLQQAMAILQQVQNIDLGPLGAELENLRSSFLETAAAAKKFGVDNRDELEKQYRFERAAIQRRFASERVGLEAMFGQRSETSAALYQLKLQFDEAGARAEALGLSTAGMGEALAAAKEEVLAQNRAQRAGIIDQARGLAGLPQTFKSSFDALMERFTAMRAEMRALGGSTAALTSLQKQATAAIKEQNKEQQKNIISQARGLSALPQTFASDFDALMDHFLALRAEMRATGGGLGELTSIQRQATAALVAQNKAQQENIITEARGLVGLPQTFKGAFDALMQRFLELRAEMRATGGGLGALTSLQTQATAALMAQRKEQQQAIIEEAKGLVGLPQTFKSTFDALMNRFLELREAMRATGGGLGALTALQQQATAALMAQRKAQLQSISVEARGLVGLPATFTQTFDELMRRFLELRAQARALGGSLGELTALQRQATAALLAQRKAQLQTIQIEAQGLTGLDPTFAQEFDALMRRFLDLRSQTRALGGDLTALTRIQREAQTHLIREQQLRQDQMALSVVTPFRQILAPLQAFQEELGLGLMNPAGQMEDAAEDFRRITLAAQSGDLQAIESFQEAAQRFIEQAGRFGSSPAQVAALEEVQRANEALMAKIEAARRDAEAGMEDVIKRASQREVDTIRELIEVARQQIEAIQRLGRR